jgi:hypothetical protein
MCGRTAEVTNFWSEQDKLMREPMEVSKGLGGKLCFSCTEMISNTRRSLISNVISNLV